MEKIGLKCLNIKAQYKSNLWDVWAVDWQDNLAVCVFKARIETIEFNEIEAFYIEGFKLIPDWRFKTAQKHIETVFDCPYSDYPARLGWTLQTLRGVCEQVGLQMPKEPGRDFSPEERHADVSPTIGDLQHFLEG